MADTFKNGHGTSDYRGFGSAWALLGVLLRHKWLIVLVSGATAMLAIAFSLLMPNEYKAEARLLAPEAGSGGGFATMLLRNLPSGASSLLGGGKGDYSRYLAILTSRSVMESVVDEFGLEQVYDLAGHVTPREATISRLRRNVDFAVDDKYGYLSISVLDRDRDRAAAMANSFVHRLNKLNSELSSQNAASYRTFVERRFAEAEARLDSILDDAQQFQALYGVVDLPAQARGFFEQMAVMRGEVVRAEIEYEASRELYGPENPRVEALRAGFVAADSKYRRALAGQEVVLPVSHDQLPAVTRQYANLEREATIQATILEIVGPMVEQARFEEEREVQAVQVVDMAVPPARKAKPKRSIIVIAATGSAFLLAISFVIGLTWWSGVSDAARAEMQRGFMATRRTREKQFPAA